MASNRIRPIAERAQETPEAQQPPPPQPVESAAAEAHQRSRRGTDDHRSFWEQVAQLDTSEWTRHKVYLYRLEPKIDNGEHAFIAKYQEAFDESQVLTDHGSGRYLAILNETKSRKAVNKTTFNVYNEGYPPKVKLAQLDASPVNDKWLEWIRRSGTEANAQPPVAPAATEQGNLAQLTAIIQRVVEKGNVADSNVQAMLMDAHKQAIGMVASQGKGSADLATLLDVLQKAKVLTSPAPQADPLSSFDMVFRLLERFQPKSVEVVDPLSSLDRALELLGKVKTLTGTDPAPSAPTSGESFWERLASAITPILAPAMPSIGNALALKFMGGSFPQQPGLPGPLPAIPVPAPDRTPAGIPDQEQYSPQMMAEIRTIVGSAAKPLFNFMGTGRSGIDFASYLVEGQGFREWQILKNFGYENLIRLIKEEPQAWAVIEPMRAQFEGFMNEFYSWTPDTDEEATEPDVAELAAA